MREFLKKTTGSITVEFIAMMPVLLAALGFTYEFGRAFWAYDVMTRDVRAAVRYLSRTYPYDATTKGYAMNFAKTGVATGGTNHFPWNSDPGGCATCVTVATVDVPSFTIGNFNETGIVFSVTGTVPLNVYLLTFLQPFGLNTTYSLSVTDQARYIGN